MKQPFKSANDYLKTQNRDLLSLLAKIKIINGLNDRLSAYLDAPIRKFCTVANLEDHRLIIIVANSSIATHLHFQSNDLLKKFKSDPLLKNIKEIQCKVQPSLPSSVDVKNRRKKMQRLSPETADIIRRMAETLEDSQLKKIMKSIALHTEE